MPKRRKLSPDELDEIVRLRGNRSSWLNIEQMTGVPRQIAKREYDVWEHRQSKEELKQARMQVATDLFNAHLEQITALAQGLVDDMPESMTPGETRDADTVISDILARCIFGEAEESVSISPSEHGADKAQRRRLRQNQMLFRSLQDHTREKVDWRVLEEWKRGWSKSRGAVEVLRSEADETVRSILDNQEPGTRNRIDASGIRDGIMANMIVGIVEVVLQGASDNAPESIERCVQTKPLGEGRTLITFAESGSLTRIDLPDSGLANDVAEVCKWAARNLSIKERDRQVKFCDGVEVMKAAIRRLEETLDPLTLRPMILRTRCDLCPA